MRPTNNGINRFLVLVFDRSGCVYHTWIQINISILRNRTVWSIWRSLLEETDKLAKAKLAAVEIFQTQIADDVKIVRQNKLQLAKKVLSHRFFQSNHN